MHEQVPPASQDWVKHRAIQIEEALYVEWLQETISLIAVLDAGIPGFQLSFYSMLNSILSFDMVCLFQH